MMMSMVGTTTGGGRYGDDHYYAGFYDDYYGSQFDDEGSLPACAYGTDCTDCQPLHGDATKKEAEPVECDNTCAYARDGFCDDPRQGGECALGTDCQDCGPASKGNFSTYEDDTWWDDDESNWYWDDDYFADGDDERRHFEDWHDDEEKKASTVGYVKSADPFAVEPDEDTGAAATFSDGFTGYGGVAGVLRRGPSSQRRPLCRAEGQRKSRLSAGRSEMTERQDKKKATRRLTARVAAAFFTMSFPRRTKEGRCPYNAGRTSSGGRDWPSRRPLPPHPRLLWVRPPALSGSRPWGAGRKVSCDGGPRCAPAMATACRPGDGVTRARRRRRPRRAPRGPWGPSPPQTSAEHRASTTRRSTCSKREPAGLGGRSPKARASDGGRRLGQRRVDADRLVQVVARRGLIIIFQEQRVVQERRGVAGICPNRS